MNIIPGIKIKGKALWIPHKMILIIADLHIGIENCMNEMGILVPRTQFETIEKELVELFDEVKPKVIIVNGDLKHEFGKISEQEWQDTFKILNILDKNCKELILVRGNHDSVLQPILKKYTKRKIKVVTECIFEDILICHGDRLNERTWKMTKKINTVIIAHEHPAISLQEGNKKEIYKCFLLGKWKNKNLIVMPSFLPMIEGMDIRKDEILSPFLKQNLNNFDVFVVSEKIYEFGKLGNLKLINA